MAILKYPLSTYTEAGAFLGGALLLRALPLEAACWCGSAIARFFSRLSQRSPAFVERQMRATFGQQYSDADYRNLVRKFYRHMGCLLAEGVRLRMLTHENIDRFVEDTPRAEDVRRLLRESPTGAFFATGHIGNWEFTGVAATLQGLLVGSVARPINNPLINEVIIANRTHCGQKIWSKHGALTNILRCLRKKESVGILVDQDAGEEGLSVPFLGRPASTVPALADLAIRTGAPIIPSAMQRTDRPMRFRPNFGEFIFPDRTADPQQERRRILHKLNEELSKIIESAPEQWLWTHRRWKTPNPAHPAGVTGED